MPQRFRRTKKHQHVRTICADAGHCEPLRHANAKSLAKRLTYSFGITKSFTESLPKSITKPIAFSKSFSKSFAQSITDAERISVTDSFFQPFSITKSFPESANYYESCD